MRTLIVGDVHFSEYSSIVRGMGERYSVRLEQCIKSINWVEQMAKFHHCDRIIYLGDFFDKATLSSAELTALQEIEWSDIQKIILVGNHEMGNAMLSQSSAHVLNLIPNATVVDTPRAIVDFHTAYIFIPYIKEESRKSLEEYGIKALSELSILPKDVEDIYVFSHNDIKGIQMGQFVSTEGFDIDDIDKHSTLYFNGHIHNGEWVSPKALNVGNLLGQNFNENAEKYSHMIYLVDTFYKTIDKFENPYALNFYKFDLDNVYDMPKFKDNSVVCVRCPESKVKEVKEVLSHDLRVITYRVISVPEVVKEKIESNKTLAKNDHINEFLQYVVNTLGSTDIVKGELERILR